MLTSALIYLAAAVISVPIAKRLGMGSVLGYLLAGVIIGPFVLQLVGDQTDVMHFAEFGVVMMLFLIGLELHPSRLWEMRKPILGIGGLQVVISAIAITSICIWLFQLPWQSALTIGLGLALSSTAIAIQSLTERGWLKSEGGSNTFSVLLFQDIAIIPILALLPLLSLTSHGGHEAHGHSSLISDFPIYVQVLISVFVIGFIISTGKYLSTPVFQFIAETHIREIFTAFALLIVIAIEVVMRAIGLSPALGAFIAGVVLAESHFRHELEVDIAPFKGLFLGLFFITVGASINFELLSKEPFTVLGLVCLLVALKGGILWFIAKGFKMEKQQGLLFTFSLAQGGEFAFVIMSAAIGYAAVPEKVAGYVTLVVALSMLLAPIFFVIYSKIIAEQVNEPDMEEEDSPPEVCDIIIAGYGRFGQIIGRLLTTQGYNITIFDHRPSRVELVRHFGNKVYFGDASRADLLETAGAKEAKLLIIATNEPDKVLDIVNVAKKHFPHLKILARSFDRSHAYELMKLNISGFKRETFDSALGLGVMALETLGKDSNEAKRAGEMFKQSDEESLEALAELWGDDHSYGIAMHRRLEDLKHVLESDSKEHTHQESEETEHPTH